jgi:thioredoxin 1
MELREDPPRVPWWAAPAQGVLAGGMSTLGSVTRGGADGEGGVGCGGMGLGVASTVNGCDVRGAGGMRRRVVTSTPALPSEAAAPQTCLDAAGLRAALAAAPRACVALTASWCAPCVRFHPKFLDLSASFPDVAFVSVAGRGHHQELTQPLRKQQRSAARIRAGQECGRGLLGN